MKTVSPALEALLQTGVFAQYEVFTLILFGGGVLRFTNCQVDITVPSDLYTLGDLYGVTDLYGTIFSASGVRVDPDGTRSTYSQSFGLDVDNWNVTVIPRMVNPLTGETYPDTINGTPWIAAAVAGALDNAILLVDRAYFAAAPTLPLPAGNAASPVGVIRLFAGLTGKVTPADTTVAIEAMDYRSLLSTQLPPNFFQAGCRHTLFDAGCGLAASGFAKAGVVGAGSTQAAIVSTIGAPAGSGTFALGRVVMTSGLNNTFSRAVRSWDGVTLKLLWPLPYTPTAGDTFTAYPGCDRTKATCALFANTVNYGGEPDIPVPESVL